MTSIGFCGKWESNRHSFGTRLRIRRNRGHGNGSGPRGEIDQPADDVAAITNLSAVERCNVSPQREPYAPRRSHAAPRGAFLAQARDSERLACQRGDRAGLRGETLKNSS